jgi:polyhydroxybutyrate depolymerase
MKITRFWLSLLAVFAVLSNSACASGQIAPRADDEKVSTGTIIVNGLTRTYLIRIPAVYDKNKSSPLLIVLHGGGGSGEKMLKLTKGAFNGLSDKDGFVVIYPDGIENHWNDGRKEVKYRTHTENIDDVAFISALIDYLVTESNIDTKRVYATGISNGAMMSYRLACDLSGKITAVAPVAGNMPQNLSKSSPANPVSILIINNTKDPLMPFDGGDITGPWGIRKLGKVLSTANSVKFWVSHNNGSLTPIVTRLDDKDPDDGTLVRKEVYGNGKDGTEVILYVVEGGGHTWPSGYQYLSETIIGKTSKDIDASELIWEFFKTKSR